VTTVATRPTAADNGTYAVVPSADPDAVKTGEPVYRLWCAEQKTLIWRMKSFSRMATP
jgi:hypothetical protein